MEARWWGLVGLVGVLAIATLGGVAAANQAPQADAGLDQEVSNGTEVFLDAGGSLDPDGDIVAYEWEVAAPDGTTVSTDCDTCSLTSFRVSQVGEYEVTLTVTDDDGASRSDTLYVEVEERGGPEASLDGPAELRPGAVGTYTLEATSGEYALDRVYWRQNSTMVRQDSLGGPDATVTIDRAYATAGVYEVSAVVVDAYGYRTRVSQRIVVNESGSGDGTGSGVDLCSGMGSGVRDDSAAGDPWATTFDSGAACITSSWSPHGGELVLVPDGEGHFVYTDVHYGRERVRKVDRESFLSKFSTFEDGDVPERVPMKTFLEEANCVENCEPEEFNHGPDPPSDDGSGSGDTTKNDVQDTVSNGISEDEAGGGDTSDMNSGTDYSNIRP